MRPEVRSPVVVVVVVVARGFLALVVEAFFCSRSSR
jgi:hypothetical protein